MNTSNKAPKKLTKIKRTGTKRRNKISEERCDIKRDCKTGGAE
jgi:hypothetical protein